MSVLRRLQLWRLGKQYAAAWDEWFAADHQVWDTALADDLDTED